MMPTRSQSSSASPMSWVQRRIEESCSSRMLRMNACTSRLLLGSSPVVGSSRSIRTGLVRSARARATFCCIPRERCSIGSSARLGAKPMFSRISLILGLASTLTRFTLRCTLLGWRTASIPKTSTEPASGRTSVEITRTSVLFPLPLGPRMPTTSPRPTASETESRARTTSPLRFLKLFSTFFISKAFTAVLSRLLQPALRLQPLPDHAPGLLALGGYRQREESARQPGAQGGPACCRQVLLSALGHPFGEVLLAQNAVLHRIKPISVHL